MTILLGDVRAKLAELGDGVVHCCVTSPPYWGLRDYGAIGQLGLEASPHEYVAAMVAVFREVRRVLRSDGTLWLNLGDTYARDQKKGDRAKYLGLHKNIVDSGCHTASQARTLGTAKPKDLIGIPWRVAFALQADGWYLRQDIIWSKPNQMPESVRDRCTKAHEYIFLLSKSERYYFDADAIAEPCTVGDNGSSYTGARDVATRPGLGMGPRIAKSGNKKRKPASARGVPINTGSSTNGAVAGSVPCEGSARNKRSVWTVATQPFRAAHFATFPPALIEPSILAGCPRGGVVLDPFFGAGTTGLVANRNGRDCIGIEINPKYAAMAERRIRDDAPLFAEVK